MKLSHDRIAKVKPLPLANFGDRAVIGDRARPQVCQKCGCDSFGQDEVAYDTRARARRRDASKCQQ